MALRTLAIPALGGLFCAACASPAPLTPAPLTPAASPAATPDEIVIPMPQDLTKTSSIPVEAVARYPLPGTSAPVSPAFSPDDALITFLHSEDGSLSRQLYGFDPASGTRRELVNPPGGGVTEDNLSLEEKLRRERARQLGLGVTSYAWAKQGSTLLIPLNGTIYVKDGPDGELRLLVDGGDGPPVLDPRLSRDGSMVGYVQDDELYVVPVRGGAPKKLTSGARGTGKTHGLAEYIAQEEMDRAHGYWWSYDGKHLAYTEVDETHIPVYRIEHQGKGQPTHEDHRYPFAGTDNARVRLGVVPAAGGKTVWMELVMDGVASQDMYLARVHWMPDGGLLAELENREQTRLDLVRFDIRTGKGRRVLQEQSDIWVNLHKMFKPLEKGEHAGGFVWASERTGFQHLYLYDGKGELVRALTSGEWMVEQVIAIDEEKGIVYFTGTKESPLERHLYAVGLGGGDISRLTQEPGMHEVVIDHGLKRFVDVWASVDTQPRMVLRSLASGEALATIYDRPDPAVKELGLAPPELVSFTGENGVTLHGAVYRPAGQGPFPTIVSVYGGPHVQRVQNNWPLTADMRAQYLRSLGYLVFKLDNRGSARRGLLFEGAIKHDMGSVEVQDQVAGVRWLVSRGLADPGRVGIYGWSYGGYMAAMALLRAGDTFKVAVAGAPVVHWDGYDTHYTERYMGTPQSNPNGYKRSSVLAHVDRMRGHLMLVHGLIDENVHFRHTARLVNALIRARKPYELLMFPDERHTPRGEKDRVYMEERIRDFFQARLR